MNHIGMLTKNSFVQYPALKKLQLAYNKVHTIEPGALASLNELELLDLSENAVKEVPPGLPRSLQELNLNHNPVMANMSGLATAVDLHTLHLRWDAVDPDHGLSSYPEFGLLPGLVALDVSLHRQIMDVTPEQLASTCRLARLNVTGTGLFPSGAHCRCRRFLGWAAEFKIAVTGLDACPEPGGGGGGEDDDPANENCTRTPEAARAVFRACMKTWDRQHTPYWAIAAGLVIAVAVVWLLLCVCRRRRRRRRGRADNSKPQPVPAVDCGVKDNDNLQAAAATAPGHKAAEPAALLA